MSHLIVIKRCDDTRLELPARRITKRDIAKVLGPVALSILAPIVALLIAFAMAGK